MFTALLQGYKKKLLPVTKVFINKDIITNNEEGESQNMLNEVIHPIKKYVFNFNTVQRK